jgi:hypothetical protein
VAGRSGGNSAQSAATHGNGERGPNSALPTGTVQEVFPTPASLAEVMLSTRQMLIEHAGECILVSSQVTLSSLYILEREILGVPTILLIEA